MEREAFDSSVIAAAGYDPSVRALEIEFVSGEVYRYFLVPARVWRELRAAGSAGSYFNAEVRDHYPEEWMPGAATR
ncbi:KTSC domain-containing protein [Leifsonia sp. 21MFCrub1.1]|uniref:KTSC domain-containing protein n=1 Tax=Leifsonia sp. 21MFCrub1.1 TaxID=1798223 RepID=UPI0008929B52|nr:KTSC domain-containing protein [Leifsonia sp. 21MFCrub1.1]SEA89808.1 KTSC domain-containing protein [Leifsonia sp. 21MFCrub1.1]